MLLAAALRHASALTSLTFELGVGVADEHVAALAAATAALPELRRVNGSDLRAAAERFLASSVLDAAGGALTPVGCAALLHRAAPLSHATGINLTGVFLPRAGAALEMPAGCCKQAMHAGGLCCAAAEPRMRFTLRKCST